MRLTPRQILEINSAFHEIYGNAELRLFGSRVDDDKKGGDIDLFIRTSEHFSTSNEKKKQKFVAELFRRLGDISVDVVVLNEGDCIENIHKEGMAGVRLQ